MNAKQTTNSKGFTIIEVVLVLAIAGLIFLMVFIALPSLQRSQRDTQRRDDISRFVSQLTSYSTNNRGAIPTSLDAITTSGTGFAEQYMKMSDNEFNDPKSGEHYTFAFGTSESNPSLDVGVVLYGGPNTHCNGENIETGGGNRSAGVATKLEGSGTFCADNQ